MAKRINYFRGMPEERFWHYVNKNDSCCDCWEWTGMLSHGYGSLRLSKGKAIASRFSWQLHFGAIPPGLHVCHRCDNRKCVRPDHLFLGTAKDNVHDCIAKERNSRGKEHGEATKRGRIETGYVPRMGPNPLIRGSLHGMSVLDEPKVLEIVRRCQAGELYNAVAAEFGMSKTTVTNIMRGKNWAHVTGFDKVAKGKHSKKLGGAFKVIPSGVSLEVR